MNFQRLRPYRIGGGSSTVAGRLREDDRMLSNDAGVYRANWVDALAILPKPEGDRDAYLNWVASQFNGFRTFCGELPWAQQTLQLVYDKLPGLMAAAASRGLYVETTALTNSASGYNVREHVSRINAIVREFQNPVVELANEPYHGTQSSDVHDPRYLISVRQHVEPNIIVALGAAENDESLETSGGDYVTAHLDRGRDKWNMVRRVRELEVVSSSTRKHVFNNEAIKFGSQCNDPAIAFCMAALNRGFEVGGILHFDDGLQAIIPSADQQRYADAWCAGFNTIATTQRMRFANTGWNESPIASADFEQDNDNDGVPNEIIRAYCFLSGELSVLAEVGVKIVNGQFTDGGIVFKNGWRRDTLLGEMRDNENARGCRIWRITQ